MARMVDIGDKPSVKRTAVASGKICMKPETVQKIKSGEIPKGDVLTVAQTAAILAVKHTPDLVPLTHPIPITSTDVSFDIEDESVTARVEVGSTGQTGVEMEALAGVAAALLTVWDMVKGLEKDEAGQYPTVKITDVKVERKVKG